MASQFVSQPTSAPTAGKMRKYAVLDMGRIVQGEIVVSQTHGFREKQELAIRFSLSAFFPDFPFSLPSRICQEKVREPFSLQGNDFEGKENHDRDSGGSGDSDDPRVDDVADHVEV